MWPFLFNKVNRNQTKLPKYDKKYLKKVHSDIFFTNGLQMEGLSVLKVKNKELHIKPGKYFDEYLFWKFTATLLISNPPNKTS